MAGSAKVVRLMAVEFQTCTVTEHPEGLRCADCRKVIDFGAAYVNVPSIFKSEFIETCVGCVFGVTEVCVDVPG